GHRAGRRQRGSGERGEPFHGAAAGERDRVDLAVPQRLQPGGVGGRGSYRFVQDGRIDHRPGSPEPLRQPRVRPLRARKKNNFFFGQRGQLGGQGGGADAGPGDDDLAGEEGRGRGTDRGERDFWRSDQLDQPPGGMGG